MDIANERKLAARSTELGNSANPQALGELAELSCSASPLVRRLAASAIGKLAGIVPANGSVQVLHPLLRDLHPQVRQYTAKALGVFGADAEAVLPDLRDIYRNPNEKNYVKRSVEASGKTIREAVRIAQELAVHKCLKCSASVSADEYARSMKAFQRVYCDHCFDETYLSRRNFDTQVELNKTIRAKDGTLVQSDGEKLIAEWLSFRKIRYRYDERIKIIQGFAVRPDFYLPEFDVYIEYWGMDTIDYKIGMLMKQKLYQQEGKRLISLYPEDKNDLDAILGKKMKAFGSETACTSLRNERKEL